MKPTYLRTYAQDDIRKACRSSGSIRYSCMILTKTGTHWQSLINPPDRNFQNILLCNYQMVYTWTDMAKLTRVFVTFHWKHVKRTVLINCKDYDAIWNSRCILKPTIHTSLLQVKYSGTRYYTAHKLILSSFIGAGYLQNQKLAHQTGISQKMGLLLLATQCWAKSLKRVQALLVPDLQFMKTRVWFMSELKVWVRNNNSCTPYCTYLNGGIPVCSYWWAWNWWCLKKPLSQNWQVNGYFRWCTSL
jgi:hypothetical protein